MPQPLTAVQRAAYVLVISLLVWAYMVGTAAAHGEHRIGLGLVSDDGLLELYVSNDGSWTLLFVDTKKTACIVGSGEGWQSIPTPSGEPL